MERIKNRRNKQGFHTSSIRRRFDGKVFINVASKDIKTQAEARAIDWRNSGFLGGYDVYIRKAK